MENMENKKPSIIEMMEIVTLWWKEIDSSDKLN